MLRRMSWQQFVYWIAYAEVEPFDELRADLRAASICAVLANIYRDPKKRREAFTPADFLLEFGKEREAPKPKQTLDQMKAIARMYATAFNEPVRNKRRRIVPPP